MRLLPIESQALDWILERSINDLELLRGKTLLFTGATGLFGKWALAALQHADDRLALGLRVLALSRKPDAFRSAFPGWASHRSMSWVAGDIRRLPPLPELRWDAVWHFATDADGGAPAATQDPFQHQVDGLRCLLDQLTARPPESLLFLSSGAVYGAFPPGVTHMGEEGADPVGLPGSAAPAAPVPGRAESPRAAYGLGKRRCEEMLLEFQSLHGTALKLARCFAVIGPHLPLDGGYAVGNFIRDGLAGGPVRVAGDGTAHRSYLHMAEAMVWLLRIFARGQGGRPYNFGSEEALSIAEVARRTAKYLGCKSVVAGVSHPGVEPAYYVPSIARARAELGLTVEWDFDEALRRTVSPRG